MSNNLSDLELNRLCATAMGWHTGRPANKVVAYAVSKCAIISGNDKGGESVYDPLHDDAQCMQLVKKFPLDIECLTGHIYRVTYGPAGKPGSESSDLNRAIVECVARMQLAKTNSVES